MPPAEDRDILVLPRRWRWPVYGGLAAVVALGFWGYRSPTLMLAWDNLLALCGLR